MPVTRRLLSLTTSAFMVTAALGLVSCSSSSTSSTPSTGERTTPPTAAPVTTIPVTTIPVTTAAPTTSTTVVVTAGGIVMVANCSGINGAAGVLTDELSARGFDTRPATNGAGIDRALDTSKIYVVPGSEALARSLSTLMGGLELFEMPTPVWIKDGTAGLGDATVLVMLGQDRAGTPLANMAG